MASSELDWTVSQSYELDSTDATSADEEESTDATSPDEEESTDATSPDEEVRMNADSTDDVWVSPTDRRASNKIPSSEILAHPIAVERSALLAALPADANAAFSQWLSGSGLAPSRH